MILAMGVAADKVKVPLSNSPVMIVGGIFALNAFDLGELIASLASQSVGKKGGGRFRHEGSWRKMLCRNSELILDYFRRSECLKFGHIVDWIWFVSGIRPRFPIKRSHLTSALQPMPCYGGHVA